LRPFWTALSQGLTESLKASAPVPQTRTTLTPDIPRDIKQKLPSVGIYLVWLLLLPCKRRKPLHSLVCPQHRAGDKKELLLMLSSFSRVRLCATPWTAAHQALPTLGFSRQKHWSGLPFPSPILESEK